MFKLLRKRTMLFIVSLGCLDTERHARLSRSWPGLPDGKLLNQIITIWVNFGGPWNGKGCYIVWAFGIYYGHLVHIMATR
jgi:hypothetical protein